MGNLLSQEKKIDDLLIQMTA